MIPVLLLAAAACADPTNDTYAEVVRPFVATHCAECHGVSEPKADLDLTRWEDARAAGEAADTWRLARELLEFREMPPRSAPQPTDAERAAVVAWVDATFGEGPAAEIDPGRPTLRRLNRTEYANTILDLLGVEFRADELFPADDVGHGFDNVGDVLSMPEILLEKYLIAAERIADRAVLSEAPPEPQVQDVPLEGLRPTQKASVHEGFRILARSGGLTFGLKTQSPGDYRVRVVATAQQAGPQVARMAVHHDGELLERFDVETEPPATETFEAGVHLEPGTHRFEVAFVNDYYEPEHPDPKRRDRNLWIASVAIVGPLEPPVPTPFQVDLRAEHPGVHEAVRALAGRAWRRPATEQEAARLLRLTGREDSWEDRVRMALTAILVSPHFLFRVEVDPEGAAAGSTHPVSDWELATRLAYFLWSSMPDDELFALAAEERLTEPAVLRAQTDRMLRDPRASALARSFAAQWLQTRNLDQVSPDPRRFPTFDDELRAAMRLETELFFEAVLREDRSVWELLDADFTFVNERLAEHYGIPGVRGAHMRRVRIPDALRGRRGGIVSQAGVLTVTSNPTRTSPVLRGKWLLETLLDAPPPPPPPGLGDLEDGPVAEAAASLRERLERHREDPSCAVCHDTMDALGFGLENYDAIGGWRELDGTFPIDASGTLPDGRSFDGPGELRRVLAADRAFLRALSKSLLVYALGRGISRADAPLVEALVGSLPAEPTLGDVARAIVMTSAFRERRIEDEDS